MHFPRRFNPLHILSLLLSSNRSLAGVSPDILTAAMSDDFSRSVELGLRLSKRVYYGKDPSLKPPKPPPAMLKSFPAADEYFPAAPMVYAVVTDPAIVENPDIPTYQPYVHGRCEPPAMIPLQMFGIEVEMECYMDSVVVTVCGSWRLHCVMGTKCCDCRIVIPMGDEGSVLGLEVEATGKSYHSQLIKSDDVADLAAFSKAENGGFLKSNIFTARIPKVKGGTKLSIKARWSQKLLYRDGQFWLSLPFSFPAYVTPGGKVHKREKIQLNVNSGTGKEILCKTCTHPLKGVRREVGKLGFLYEADVCTWSQTDFQFSYAVSSSDIIGGLLLQSPALHDFDERKLFSFYLFPGDVKNRTVFRKKVVFLVDISGSMQGPAIENVKKSLLASLKNLSPEDFFNIVSFNEEACLFSISMVRATQEAFEEATQWISTKLNPIGGTNIMLPLKQALQMFSKKSNLMSFIFLITDGTVENERAICNVVKEHLENGGLTPPRISTFGIGSYCNHYFLQMLSHIGRGHYDAAYDIDSIAPRLEALFTKSSSIILANIEVDHLDHLASLTLYPSRIQDLSCESPLIVSGRYSGNFPDSVKMSGTLADMSSFTLELEMQKAKDIPVERVFAKRQIDVLTAQAWFAESKQLEEQVAKISMQTGIPSEYSRMIVVQAETEKSASEFIMVQGREAYDKNELHKKVTSRKILLLPPLGMGFGDSTKTAQNVPPCVTVKKRDAKDMIVKAASGCCHQVLDRVCCMCFIQACSKMNDQCVVVMSQVCAALACFECINCCFELCSGD